VTIKQNFQSFYTYLIIQFFKFSKVVNSECKTRDQGLSWVMSSAATATARPTSSKVSGVYFGGNPLKSRKGLVDS